MQVWSTENWMTNFWIEGMKALLGHIKGITSGTHSAPEKIWLPFHASKGCQGTVHYMSLQDIVQLCRSPTWTCCSSLICFVGKTQLILQVLPNPLCQLCRQPAQGRAGRPVHVLQLRWYILNKTKYIKVYTHFRWVYTLDELWQRTAGRHILSRRCSMDIREG